MKAGSPDPAGGELNDAIRRVRSRGLQAARVAGLPTTHRVIPARRVFTCSNISPSVILRIAIPAKHFSDWICGFLNPLQVEGGMFASLTNGSARPRRPTTNDPQKSELGRKKWE